MNDLGEIIAALHDSEITGEISWFFDQVWTVKLKLGDPPNGYDVEAVVSSLDEAAERLRATAIKLYPKSEFAERYGVRLV
jgi:hypothetical protein